MDCDRYIEVIIPVYNCKRFLREAVQSVLDQSYQLIEIILIDDGSTDGSTSLCEELAEIYDQVYFLHQENSGVSSARNIGIEYVLSQKSNILSKCYIAFLDADDIWAPDFFSPDVLELLLKNLDILGFTSAKCNCNLTMRAKEIDVKVGLFFGGEKCLKARREHFASMLYSAKLINDYNIRFMNGLKYGEDNIFRYECLYVCDKGYIEQRLLYLYRENEKSAVHNRKYGLDYYVPLLNAYLTMDSEMSCWANETRGICSAGKGIVSFYIKEMIDEHIINFGSVKDIFEAERNFPELFNNPELMQMLSNKRERWKIIIANYAKGILFRVLRKIRYCSLFSWIVEKRRYPIKM